MDDVQTGVCRTCRRPIFRHGGGAWLHEYHPLNEQHAAEPRVDPEGSECAGRVMFSRMLDADQPGPIADARTPN